MRQNPQSGGSVKLSVYDKEGTPEGNLLEFFKNYPTKSTDEMVLTACREPSK